ncbi:MAG: hypothetical protein MJ154_00535 [Candidatus Saccharibacteria bacterium]|nr:hypothetical protein [Candidatus Saccharibacteria bacterium]
MTIDYLKQLTDEGREIKLKYNDKIYWITWSQVSGENLLYFYEADSDSEVSAKTVDELIEKSYDGHIIKEIWKSLTDEDVWVE